MPIKKIVITCIGNICRSPLAEVLFQKELGERYIVSSAGIAAMVGEGAHRHSRTIAHKYGLDLSQHKARQLTEALVKENDLVLPMTSGEKKEIERMFPFGTGKIMRIGEWNTIDVEDPYGKDLIEFERVYSELRESLEYWRARL